MMVLDGILYKTDFRGQNHTPVHYSIILHSWDCKFIKLLITCIINFVENYQGDLLKFFNLLLQNWAIYD